MSDFIPVDEWIKGGFKKVNETQDHQIEQIALINQYIQNKTLSFPLKEHGFKVYSEYDEDGILLYIFATIGTRSKRVLELCCGDGIECMSANLIINHGWEGLLLDGDVNSILRGKNFYSAKKITSLFPPKLMCEWIRKDTIRQLIVDQNFAGEIDLLSLDMDGNDYHILEILTSCIRPRVIVCEIQNRIPAHKMITIPYSDSFIRGIGQHKEFYGTSLGAVKKLLNQRGYRLVGSNRYGFNVFFILDEECEGYFHRVDIETIYDNPYTQSLEKEWDEIKDLGWIEV